MVISNEERKRIDAERQREYRRTHPNYDRHHNARQERYIERIKSGIIPVPKSLIRIKETEKETNHKQKCQIKVRRNTDLIKRKVLTHYGRGKCACVKCGIDDIDCLNLDHINNDAHHRQNNGRVGGEALYKKLMNQNYPTGYQTLCHNCNQKKALEFCRKNGGHKKGKPMETTLPLLEIIQEDAETCHFDIMGA
jgi:hypothetical protein